MKARVAVVWIGMAIVVSVIIYDQIQRRREGQRKEELRTSAYIHYERAKKEADPHAAVLEFSEAIRLLEEGGPGYPDLPFWYAERGMRFSMIGDVDAANRDFREANRTGFRAYPLKLIHVGY